MTTKIPIGNYETNTAAEDSMVADIVEAHGWGYDSTKEAVEKILDILEYFTINRMSVRIQGVGHLMVRKTENGKWIGRVNRRPLNPVEERVVKQDKLISMITAKCSHPDNLLKHCEEVWRAFSDLVADRLRNGRSVRIRNLGTIYPKHRCSNNLKWHITHTTQARISHQAFTETLVDVKDG